MDRIKKSLDEVIAKDIQDMTILDSGSDERSTALKELTELYKLRIEENRVEMERKEKESQEKSHMFDRWVNVGLQVGLTALSLIAYNVWYRRGLKFEETGTVTSSMTRNLMSKMLPNKK